MRDGLPSSMASGGQAYAAQCLSGKGKRPPKVAPFTLETRPASALTARAFQARADGKDRESIRAASYKAPARRAADSAAVAAFLASRPVK